MCLSYGHHCQHPLASVEIALRLRASEVNTPTQDGYMANSERQAVIAELIGEVFV